MSLAEEIAALQELNSFTFESNKIVDQEAICALFANLKSFEKLENLNVRNNRLSSEMVDALAEGIASGRELRVSDTNSFFCIF